MPQQARIVPVIRRSRRLQSSRILTESHINSPKVSSRSDRRLSSLRTKQKISRSNNVPLPRRSSGSVSPKSSSRRLPISNPIIEKRQEYPRLHDQDQAAPKLRSLPANRGHKLIQSGSSTTPTATPSDQMRLNIPSTFHSLSSSPNSNLSSPESTVVLNGHVELSQLENGINQESAYPPPSNSPQHGGIRVPIGFRNTGNICFMNSVLQALLAISKLRKIILRCVLDARIYESLNIGECLTGLVVFKTLSTILTDSSVHTGQGYDTELLAHVIKVGCGGMNFDADVQHDAHEFLVHVRGQIGAVLRTAADEKTLHFVEDCNAELVPFQYNGHQFEGPSGMEFIARNAIESIFQGKLWKNKKCSQCGLESPREEVFQDLSLAIDHSSDDRECTLARTIENYFADEEFQGDNQYYCDTCGKNCDAVLQTSLRDYPDVLTLHLLLFKQQANGMTGKVTCNVAIPRTLDMSNFAEPENAEEAFYSLSAVVVHCGSSRSSGHYITVARDPTSSRWYYFNDEKVQLIADNVLDPLLSCSQNCITNPYILFYSRCKGVFNRNE